jgi:hypothetical protein
MQNSSKDAKAEMQQILIHAFPRDRQLNTPTNRHFSILKHISKWNIGFGTGAKSDIPFYRSQLLPAGKKCGSKELIDRGSI